MKKRFTEDSWRDDLWFRALCSALKTCKKEEDIADFLRDIGTLSELQAWSERLEVAKQLAKGFPYRQISENTGASTTTVTRVARFLESGEGGYRKVLNVIKEEKVELSPTEILKKRKERHQHHTKAPSGERSVSVLRKYLPK